MVDMTYCGNSTSLSDIEAPFPSMRKKKTQTTCSRKLVKCLIIASVLLFATTCYLTISPESILRRRLPIEESKVIEMKKTLEFNEHKMKHYMLKHHIEALFEAKDLEKNPGELMLGLLSLHFNDKIKLRVNEPCKVNVLFCGSTSLQTALYDIKLKVDIEGTNDEVIASIKSWLSGEAAKPKLTAEHVKTVMDIKLDEENTKKMNKELGTVAKSVELGMRNVTIWKTNGNAMKVVDVLKKFTTGTIFLGSILTNAAPYGLEGVADENAKRLIEVSEIEPKNIVPVVNFFSTSTTFIALPFVFQIVTFLIPSSTDFATVPSSLFIFFVFSSSSLISITVFTCSAVSLGLAASPLSHDLMLAITSSFVPSMSTFSFISYNAVCSDVDPQKSTFIY
jgi:hypothetical protein